MHRDTWITVLLVIAGIVMAFVLFAAGVRWKSRKSADNSMILTTPAWEQTDRNRADEQPNSLSGEVFTAMTADRFGKMLFLCGPDMNNNSLVRGYIVNADGSPTTFGTIPIPAAPAFYSVADSGCREFEGETYRRNVSSPSS
jgi:hypothetical protein